MREYCLVKGYNPTFKTGLVLNMAVTGKSEGPYLTDYQREQGMEWVPVAKVSQVSLRKYQYWNERP